MPAPPEPLLPVLALDTSTETLAAGLQTGRDAFTVQAPGGARASAALLPQLQGLLQRAGVAWGDLRAIAFGHGPGAFTGLRTACAVAQGLGFGLDRPLLPLDSLLIVAEDARVQLGAGQPEGLELAVAMDARIDEIYAARYRYEDGRWTPLQAPALMTLPAWKAAWAAAPLPVLAGSALAVFGDRLGLAAGVRCVAQEHDRAAALLRLAVAAATAGPGVDAAQALPLYLRDKVAFTTAEREATRDTARDAGSPAAREAGHDSAREARPDASPDARPAAPTLQPPVAR